MIEDPANLSLLKPGNSLVVTPIVHQEKDQVSDWMEVQFSDWMEIQTSESECHAFKKFRQNNSIGWIFFPSPKGVEKKII